MKANDTQVGGSHYAGEYQHWDFVCDTKMPYLLGCATKYVARWRNKNGVEDLRKAIHYIQKAEERRIKMILSIQDISHILAFSRTLPSAEASIVRAISAGNRHLAIREIEELIEEYEAAEPGSGYVNQD